MCHGIWAARCSSGVETCERKREGLSCRPDKRHQLAGSSGMMCLVELSRVEVKWPVHSCLYDPVTRCELPKEGCDPGQGGCLRLGHPRGAHRWCCLLIPLPTAGSQIRPSQGSGCHVSASFGPVIFGADPAGLDLTNLPAQGSSLFLVFVYRLLVSQLRA